MTKKLLARDPSLLSEAEWSGLVLDVARVGGWERRYHTFSSRRSPHGFPDWVFLHPGRTRHADEGTLRPELLFVELKSETGKVKPEQELWIAALGALEDAIGDFYANDGDGTYPALELHYESRRWNIWTPVRVRLWRPSDYPEVVETLTGRKPREEHAQP